MASKRKALTLIERIDIIKELEKGQSPRELAAKFGIGRTQIQCILKRKAKVMAECESVASLSMSRNARPTGNEPINEFCLKWFLEVRTKRSTLAGLLFRKKLCRLQENETSLLSLHLTEGSSHLSNFAASLET